MILTLFFLGSKNDDTSIQDWPIIDEAGYASLIRKGKKASISGTPDEPVYEKIQENKRSR